MDEKVKEKINLAIAANGGTDFRKEWCQCDPSIGAVPCEYCAIRAGAIRPKRRRK